MAGAMGGARGCGGGRTQGDCYFETGLEAGGRPIEEFLMDPPVVLPPELVRVLPVRGVVLRERVVKGVPQGIWDVWDKVGGSHYPNVADFVEEVRRMGVSRKLSLPPGEYAKITPETRIILWHNRAFVRNWRDYGPYRYAVAHYAGRNNQDCLKNLPAHAVDVRNVCCSSIWWNDLQPEEKSCSEDPEGTVSRGTRPIGTDTDPYLLMPLVERRIANTVYFAHQRPALVAPEYEPAVFGTFPCSRLAVIAGRDYRETFGEGGGRPGAPGGGR